MRDLETQAERMASVLSAKISLTMGEVTARSRL
jgi:hypothetical protein